MNDYNLHGNDYLVSNDNELFVFDNDKPVIDTSREIIEGYSANKKPIILSLRKIKGFYKNIPDTVSRYNFLQLDSSAVKCFAAINVNDSTMHLIYPNKNGCKYYQQKEILEGFSKTGENEIIDINDIKSYKIKKFDPGLTLICILITIGFLALIIYEEIANSYLNFSGGLN